MIWRTKSIDMHCDTLMGTYLNGVKEAADEEARQAAIYNPQGDVYETPGASIDILRLLAGGAMAQFFAIFIPPQAMYEHFMKMDPISNDDYIEGMAKVFENTLARHPYYLAKATNAEEIERNFSEGKLSAVLTMEDGVAVQGDMAKLDHYYDLGVRALSLTWNFKNCFGSPNSKDPEIMAEGLTDFGKEAVKHMQDIGMLVDVSHLSDGGFWDVVKLSKEAGVPFVATHSNCRALCGHTRNMTDDMILALHECGGAMGINFGPEFLDGTEGNHDSRVADMVKMALHEKEVTGSVDVIALGTDFDGIEGNLEVSGPDRMHLLLDGLVEAGFTLDEIDKITHKNVLRVMRASVK